MTNILTYNNITITEQIIYCCELTGEQNNTINHLFNRHKGSNKYTFQAVYKYNDNAILKVRGNTHKQTLILMIFKNGDTMANSSLKDVINKIDPIYNFSI